MSKLLKEWSEKCPNCGRPLYVYGVTDKGLIKVICEVCYYKTTKTQ